MGAQAPPAGGDGVAAASRRAALRAALAGAATLAALAVLPASSAALGTPATPIPQNPSDVEAVPAFTGSPAKPPRVRAPVVPQHPLMAPNGRSNLHDAAYPTNTSTWSGPPANP